MARFVPYGNVVIADREYNVVSLARAAMNATLDVLMATPNQFSAILLPYNLKVDLIALQRKQETSDNQFACMEVVREIVTQGDSVVLKEVETVSLYERIDDATIRCKQRSAMYLLPSQNDPVALKQWQASQGKSVDVRYYDVLYTKTRQR
jgi:hypothetical protein